MKKKIISIISILAVSVSALTTYAVNPDLNAPENNPDTVAELAAENTIFAGVYIGDNLGMYSPIKQNNSSGLGNDLFLTFDDCADEYYEELLSRGETHTPVRVSVEMPKEGEIYFGYISDNNGYISEIPSEDGKFSEELDLYARGARVIIKYVSGEKEYYTHIILKDTPVTINEYDGAVIYLSVSDGRFKESFLTSPEEYGKAVLNESCGAGISIDANEYWSQLWRVSGAEGVSVGRVERMDDKTLKLTLAGSSDNKSKELFIAFDREEYMDDDYWYEEFGVEDEADGTLHFGMYQLNSVGQVAAMYSLDNSVKIYKKSSGGGGGSVRTTASPKPEVTTQPQETAVPEKKSIIVSTEDGRVKISVNSVPVVYSENRPFIDENRRTRLPIRAVMETLGAEVEWNEADKSVKITYSGDEIILKIGSNVLLINGKERIMDTSAVIIKDSTYIPLRAVAEALGMEVVWK